MKLSHPLLLLLSVSARLAPAATYYVSPQGDDANPGTLGQPFSTIQKGADSLLPGDTLYVRDGTYHEEVSVNVSGSLAAGFVSIVNYAGETPIIDGGGLVPASDDYSGLFYILDQSFIRIEGFELRNFVATQGNGAPSGIHIEGAAHDIQIRGNNIHAIEFDTVDGNAFGISVYGTSRSQSITNLVIDGNDVHHLKTGNSESVTLNGNVSHFAVTNNQVHDNNNIGIDFIGFEKTCPLGSRDQARDGVCQDNHVWNISSATNPAYRGDTSATGIYCDGAARVVIERNVISACDYGAELSSEHRGKTASACTFRDNFVYRCLHPGLSLGGYDLSTTGGTSRCTISNNTFFQNDTGAQGYGEVLLQFRVTSCSFRNNLFIAGAPSLFIANAATSVAGDTFDYNLYFAPLGLDASGWQWKNHQLTGLAAWKKATRQDSHSFFADPQLADSNAPDLHLQGSSPAINAGDPKAKPTLGEIDIDHQPRVNNGRLDIGADEF